MTPDHLEAIARAGACRPPCQAVVRLNSGNYAIFQFFLNTIAMHPLYIGTWAECEAFVAAYPYTPPEEKPTFDFNLDL